MVVGKSVNVLEVVIRVPSVCVMHTRKESAGRNARSSSGSDPEIPLFNGSRSNQGKGDIVELVRMIQDLEIFADLKS